jgi:hypothetical protein
MVKAPTCKICGSMHWSTQPHAWDAKVEPEAEAPPRKAVAIAGSAKSAAAALLEALPSIGLASEMPPQAPPRKVVAPKPGGKPRKPRAKRKGRVK